jgi:hypothetical protein
MNQSTRFGVQAQLTSIKNQGKPGTELNKLLSVPAALDAQLRAVVPACLFSRL